MAPEQGLAVASPEELQARSHSWLLGSHSPRVKEEGWKEGSSLLGRRGVSLGLPAEGILPPSKTKAMYMGAGRPRLEGKEVTRESRVSRSSQAWRETTPHQTLFLLQQLGGGLGGKALI